MEHDSNSEWSVWMCLLWLAPFLALLLLVLYMIVMSLVQGHSGHLMWLEDLIEHHELGVTLFGIFAFCWLTLGVSRGEIFPIFPMRR